MVSFQVWEIILTSKLLSVTEFTVKDIPSNEIFNIGRGKQVELMDFIKCISNELGREANVTLAPRHPADTLETWADTYKLRELGYKPRVNIEQGVESFIRWYKDYYGVN